MTLDCMYMYGVDGCTDGHAFTKSSRIYSLPVFLISMVLCLNLLRPEGGALESHLAKN